MAFSWLLGSAGLIAMEVSYLPQIARLFRLKRADELSYSFPALNLAGRLCAFAYSVAVGNNIFTVGFFVGSVLRLTLLVQIMMYRRRPRPALTSERLEEAVS